MKLLRTSKEWIWEFIAWQLCMIEGTLSESEDVCTCEPRDAFAVIDGSTRMNCPKCEDNRRKSSGPPLISTFVRRRAE